MSTSEGISRYMNLGAGNNTCSLEEWYILMTPIMRQTKLKNDERLVKEDTRKLQEKSRSS